MNTVNNTLGASNLSKKQRSALDYYGTNPKCVEALLERERFQNRIWEPCSGHGNISKTLKAKGFGVRSTDVFDYGEQDEIADFLAFDGEWDGDIITNPPYCLAEEMAKKAIESVRPGAKIAMFLRLQFLEGQSRYDGIFSKNPPKAVYCFPKRQVCSAKDDFTEGSAVAYCWIVWEKGYEGDPALRWLGVR